MERGLITLKDFMIGDRIYEIPIYQRHYSWGERQLEDLWDDLVYLDPDKKHYFGTLLLKKKDRSRKIGLKSYDTYEIIDGQQRVASVLILLREIISQLSMIEDEDILDELDKLEEDYLKYKTVYKLVLLGSDKEFFKQYIIDDEEYPDEILTSSQRRLRDAKMFFRERLEEDREEEDDFAEFLLEIKHKLDDMEIIRYEVDDDADGVLIFETVNDRGKPLTNLEKTKSFIMHTLYLASPEEPEEVSGYLDKVNESFANIYRWYEEIISTERGKNLGEDDIQRYHFILFEEDVSRRRETSHQYLEHIKKKIRNLYRYDDEETLDYALSYTQDLEKTFFAIKEIMSFEEEGSVGASLAKIFILERVANFLPLLAAIWMKWKDEKAKIKDEEVKIEGILNLIEAFVFRVYAMGRRRADTGESPLSDLAHRVHRKGLEYDAILEELGNLIHSYEDDRSFRSSLRHVNFAERVARRDIKYLLFEYEKYLRKQAREPLDFELSSILSPDFQIEHIWAKDPSRLELDEELLEDHANYNDSLGNLTIASRSWNASWGNKPFVEKKEEYHDSSLRVQRVLYDYEEWGVEQIEEREQKIIKFALKRWKWGKAKIIGRVSD